MSNLGLGLSRNEETVPAIKSSLNKKITDLRLVDDILKFTFEDNGCLHVWDGGQDCCEHRYMTTDDDLRDYIGAVFTNIEIRDVEVKEDMFGVHEIQFLLIATSKGVFTIETHNEHNGNYGGFWIVAEVVGK